VVGVQAEAVVVANRVEAVYPGVAVVPVRLYLDNPVRD